MIKRRVEPNILLFEYANKCLGGLKSDCPPDGGIYLQQKFNHLAMGVLKWLINCFLDVLKEVTIFMFFLYETDNFQLFN